MLSAIGPFAIEESLVKAKNGHTEVRVKSVNTGSLIHLLVPTPKSKVIYSGNFSIDGVPSSGAPILLKFYNLEGNKTGKLFPANEFITKIEDVNVTCIDFGNPMVLGYAKDFFVRGTETSNDLNNNKSLLNKIERIRKISAIKMGMGDVKGKVLPKFALLSKSNQKGSIVSRYFTPYSCHQTHAVTGALCVAVSCLIPGTISHHLYSRKKKSYENVKIEHPLGEIECLVELNKNFKFNLFQSKSLIMSCGVYRTSRKIMKGLVYVPKTD